MVPVATGFPYVVVLLGVTLSFYAHLSSHCPFGVVVCEASTTLPSTIPWTRRQRKGEEEGPTPLQSSSPSAHTPTSWIKKVNTSSLGNDDEIITTTTTAATANATDAETATATAEEPVQPIGLAGYRRDYDTSVTQEPLLQGGGRSFVFQRFQSPPTIRRAFDSVRSSSTRTSFRWFEGKDGRKGYVSSTRLGGDYVLAESEQVAVNCTAEEVLRAYLSGSLQTYWNARQCQNCIFTKVKKTNTNARRNDKSTNTTTKKTATTKGKGPSLSLSFSSSNARLLREPLHYMWSGGRSSSLSSSSSPLAGDKRPLHTNNDNDKDDDNDNGNGNDDGYFYLQDLFLKSQRVIRTQTGPMRYQQIIEIDKVGLHNYSVLVRLWKQETKNHNDNHHHQERNKENQNGVPEDINFDLDPHPHPSLHNHNENHRYGNYATAKKPFESLEVYVGLEQVGPNVNIYAAGVFEVNRSVVPNLIVFDTSGFAGSVAGKGTLWLSAHFERQARRDKETKRAEH